jgi:uncharacterized membrane protein (DUF485 family)
MNPHRAYILLTLCAAALFALAMLAGCGHFFGHAGATLPPSTHHLLSNPSTESSLNMGKVLAVLMMVAGAVIAAVGFRRGNWMPGVILSGAGLSLFFLLDLYSTFRPFLFAGAALMAAGSVTWWIVTHRKRLAAEYRDGGVATPAT